MKEFSTDFSFKLINLSDEDEYYNDAAVEEAYNDYCDFWHRHGFEDSRVVKINNLNMDLG